MVACDLYHCGETVFKRPRFARDCLLIAGEFASHANDSTGAVRRRLYLGGIARLLLVREGKLGAGESQLKTLARAAAPCSESLRRKALRFSACGHVWERGLPARCLDKRCAGKMPAFPVRRAVNG